MVFSDRMVPEVYQTFWAAMARGEFITDAAAEAGTYRRKGAGWLAAAGGVRPRRGRDLKRRCLTLTEREEIALGRARGDSVRKVAELIGRSPSTVSRELRRNSDGLGHYRATSAHAVDEVVLNLRADRRGGQVAVIGDPQRLGNLPGRVVGQGHVAQLSCRTRSS
jgi:DNA-binding CsgD family transcriptional regulator